MFDSLMKMIKGISKRPELIASSKDTAKERLHLVLMQEITTNVNCCIIFVCCLILKN